MRLGIRMVPASGVLRCGPPGLGELPPALGVALPAHLRGPGTIADRWTVHRRSVVSARWGTRSRRRGVAQRSPRRPCGPTWRRSGGTFRAVVGPSAGHVTGFVEDELEIKIGPVSEYTLVSTMFGAVARRPGRQSGNVPVEDYCGRAGPVNTGWRTCS